MKLESGEEQLKIMLNWLKLINGEYNAKLNTPGQYPSTLKERATLQSFSDQLFPIHPQQAWFLHHVTLSFHYGHHVFWNH